MRIKYETPIKLDLGCGAYKKDGFTGLDRLDFGQEIIFDVRNCIPLPDDSVTEIYSSHFFEHLTYSELEPLAEELKRVMTNDCVLTIRVPHKNTDGAWDYSHRSFWDEISMRSWLRSAGFNVLEINNLDGNLTSISKKL